MGRKRHRVSEQRLGPRARTEPLGLCLEPRRSQLSFGKSTRDRIGNFAHDCQPDW